MGLTLHWLVIVSTTVHVYPSDLQRARNEGRSPSCRFWNFTADGEQMIYIHMYTGIACIIESAFIDCTACTFILLAMSILSNHLAQFYNILQPCNIIIQ